MDFHHITASAASSFLLLLLVSNLLISLLEGFTITPAHVQHRHRKAFLSADVNFDTIISSNPVLSQVYPSLIEYKEKYGHPNIPLGSKEGKQCQTLRRLHVQEKLSEDQVKLLTDLGFYWHSLEDVYKTSDFDELYGRLVGYSKATGDVSPPKKYPPDPELGAWVTGIRRVGIEGIQPEHAEKLNAINFQWTSPRKCGSAFMQQYREIQTRNASGEKDILANDVKVQAWVKAQQDACARGALSETRKHYMETVVGDNWMEWKPL
jgi:hypothetical protein